MRDAGRVREAFEHVESGEEFVSLLKRAFGDPNNLTSWRAHGEFLGWAADNPEEARRTLRILANSGLKVEEGVDRFLDLVPDGSPSGPGVQTSIASFLLMGLDPEEFPMYRTTDYRTVERALGWPEMPEGSSSGQTYAHVTPERTFPRSFGRVDGPRSISHQQRPDICVEVESPGGGKRVYLLDPKYKLDSEVAGEEEGGKTGRPNKSDTDKMHAYRDAIRDASGTGRPLRRYTIPW